MKIRSKIILITLPLIVTPLIITLILASLSARNGITFIANDFLKFKSEILLDYMDSQWNTLVNNNLSNEDNFISLSKSAVTEYAENLIKKESELIYIFNETGSTVFSTGNGNISVSEKAEITDLIKNREYGWHEIYLSGSSCVAVTSFFDPFQWYVIVAAEKKAFYGIINTIFLRTSLVLAVSLMLSVVFLVYFSSFLTKPLEHVADVIRNILSTNDLSVKVPVLYNDETGSLSHYFNMMTEQLNQAYMQLKKYALRAVIAHKKEMRIRNIFQKYVPTDVIDTFFTHPESMLTGENRVLSILFSDIRSFTTISEGLAPDDLVNSLNKYFETMVDIILNHNGIVDKYIGDAIMAFFGAPVKHQDDPLQSVTAALDMLDSLKDFNKWEFNQGRAEFKIGIGINYGVVTVGNIGSDKKMDYTVIGDMVNLASRLEGLTKKYKEQIIISESLYKKVFGDFPCRMLDIVRVKGKKQSVKIYSVCREITPEIKAGWDYFHLGQKYYYNRDFEKAYENFKLTREYIPDDFMSKIFEDRAVQYMLNPELDEDWTGEIVLEDK